MDSRLSCHLQLGFSVLPSFLALIPYLKIQEFYFPSCALPDTRHFIHPLINVITWNDLSPHRQSPVQGLPTQTGLEALQSLPRA